MEGTHIKASRDTRKREREKTHECSRWSERRDPRQAIASSVVRRLLLVTLASHVLLTSSSSSRLPLLMLLLFDSVSREQEIDERQTWMHEDLARTTTLKGHPACVAKESTGAGVMRSSHTSHRERSVNRKDAHIRTQTHTQTVTQGASGRQRLPFNEAASE